MTAADMIVLTLLSGAFIFPPSRLWTVSARVGISCLLIFIATVSLVTSNVEVLMVVAVILGLDHLNTRAGAKPLRGIGLEQPDVTGENEGQLHWINVY